MDNGALMNTASRFCTLLLAFFVTLMSPSFGLFGQGWQPAEEEAVEVSTKPVVEYAPRYNFERPAQAVHEKHQSLSQADTETPESPMQRWLRTRGEENQLIGPSAEMLEARRFQPEPGDYRLRVGDTLRISIYGELSSERIVTVDNHGQISYLLVGTVLAVGKTIDELRNELNDLVKNHLQYGIVNVTPVEFGGLHFTILGQVNFPGKKPVLGTTYLLNAIARAGGMRMGYFRASTVELADLKHAFLARNGRYIPINFEKLLLEGDMTYNVEIQAGDYIYIPSSLRKDIYVIGELVLPANIGYLNQESLVGALAKARGVNDRAGDWAYIVRGSLTNPSVIEVNIEQLYNGQIPDVLLQPGDIVYVPERGTLFLEEVIYTAIEAFIGGFADIAGRELLQAIIPDSENDDFNNIFIP